MYLSKKQFKALDMALEAMDAFASGYKDEEQEEAYSTILDMIQSGRETVCRTKIKRKKKMEGRNIEAKRRN